MISSVVKLLDQERQELVASVRGVLTDLQPVLASVPAAKDDQAIVRESVEQLDDVFLLVVVGEFNSGKSTLINALLGARVLEQGVTPTTTTIQVLRHAEEPTQTMDGGVRLVTADAPLLEDIHLVDTPGTNAITREHEALTRRFMPRADLILFATSADRPFTESEHKFMEAIREWGKKIVVVVNKTDILTAKGDLQKVCAYVRDSVNALLAFAPEVFAVSATGALDAKEHDEPERLDRSGLPALEQFVFNTLSDAERFRLKLLSPLGVGLRLTQQYAAVIEGRLETLADDVSTVDQIRSLLVGFERELGRGLQLRLAEIDNALYRLEKKGNAFFEETVRIGRLVDLVNRTKVRNDFERDVVGDLAHEIEKIVEAVIDWLVVSNLRQWQEVRARLAQRQSQHSERVVDRLGEGFEYDRARLLEAAGTAVEETLERHDQKAEAVRIADSIQAAVTNAALLEVGAVGLGGAVSLLATSSVVDVTGVLAAGLMATVGFLVIPRRRRRAKHELQHRVGLLRAQLSEVLTAQFDKEASASVRRLEDLLGPYVQFVNGEQHRLKERVEQLSDIARRVQEVRSNVNETEL